LRLHRAMSALYTTVPVLDVPADTRLVACPRLGRIGASLSARARPPRDVSDAAAYLVRRLAVPPDMSRLLGRLPRQLVGLRPARDAWAYPASFKPLFTRDTGTGYPCSTGTGGRSGEPHGLFSRSFRSHYRSYRPHHRRFGGKTRRSYEEARRLLVAMLRSPCRLAVPCAPTPRSLASPPECARPTVFAGQTATRRWRSAVFDGP
jgi:hypothetical protein